MTQEAVGSVMEEGDLIMFGSKDQYLSVHKDLQ